MDRKTYTRRDVQISRIGTERVIESTVDARTGRVLAERVVR